MNEAEWIMHAHAMNPGKHKDFERDSMFPVIKSLYDQTVSGLASIPATTAEVDGSVLADRVITGTSSSSPQTILVAEAAFYTVYVTHYVTSASTAGLHTLGIGFTDGAGSTTIYPAADLVLSGLNRQYGSVTFFANNGTNITYDSDVTVDTITSCSFSIRIKVVKLS